MIKIAVFLAPCEEGGFTAYIPSLPGCISEGETIDEALANIREAFELYVEPTEDDLIPEEDDAILQEIELDWSPRLEAGEAALGEPGTFHQPVLIREVIRKSAGEAALDKPGTPSPIASTESRSTPPPDKSRNVDPDGPGLDLSLAAQVRRVEPK